MCRLLTVHFAVLMHPTFFKRLAKIIREAHYQSYVVLEYEEFGNVRAECEKYTEQMREAFN
jgi:hypothetical protein